jgi:predicted nucleic acid-binding Zn ribbon protein
MANPRKRKLPDPPDPDDPARHAPPAPLADVMSALATKRGWTRRLDGAQIHTRWREIAGDDLASHVEPVRLHGGVLVLRVESNVWATQVRYLAGELVERANAVLGAGAVHTVTVTTGRLKGPRE